MRSLPAAARSCRGCDLWRNATQTVFGVVKHFKWEPRGKRRLHKTPNVSEVNACRPWFDAELTLIQPDVLVCLGATAAKALLGPAFRVSKEHGRFVASDLAPHVTATSHPSAVLRARDSSARTELMRALVADLRKVAKVMNGG